jgi:DNA-binding HxlR family transcriptional regulator
VSAPIAPTTKSNTTSKTQPLTRSSHRSAPRDQTPHQATPKRSAPIDPKTYAQAYPPLSPALEALVREIIARIADKWTMLVLDILAEHGTVRFTHLGKLVGDISQKMLTQTLRQMESDGLVTRTVHPVIPPHVDYRLTDLGYSLGEAFCGVWIWAEKHSEAIAQSRATFRQQSQKPIQS